MDISEFLLARIAEDEADAEHWHYTSANGYGKVRVLAECEAKRRIVMAGAQAEVLRQSLGGEELKGYVLAMVDAVKFLAECYASHPDYREEWKPLGLADAVVQDR